MNSLSAWGTTRTSFKIASVGKPESVESVEVHVNCPGLVLYFPASQLAQVEATLAPTASENLPAVQSVHLEEPETGLYLPGAQLVQTVEASAAEYFPASQLVQTVEAVPAVYLPAVHNEQVAADADVAPVCPYAPAEHRVPEQVDEEVADEYVPA